MNERSNSCIFLKFDNHNKMRFYFNRMSISSLVLVCILSNVFAVPAATYKRTLEVDPALNQQSIKI